MLKNIFNKPTRFYWMLPFVLGSSALFADTIGFTEHSAWDLGVQALYLKPAYSDGFAYLDDTRVAPNTDKRNPLKLRWGWGYKIEGSYHFCPNSDLNLNWYHYKKTSSGTFVFRTNPIADAYTVTPEWDAVNLEFGQSMHFDQIKHFRLHGGLQYARIKTKVRDHGVDPMAGPGIEHDNMRFNGVGPRIGVDTAVGLFKGLSVYFGGDFALLVGRSRFNFTETFGTPLTISGSRPTVIVPEIGVKIGARYDYALPCGNLVFDLGYLAVNYFNPLHLRDDFTASETNFALHGFYAGIKFILG